jgi:hypothetical protein
MLRFILSLLFAIVVGSAMPSLAAAGVINFEDLALAGANAFQNGATIVPPGSFTSGGAKFANSYNATFGSWSGWSYSNVVNTTTPGFMNQYAAFAPGGGDQSAQYGVGTAFSPNSATISLPTGEAPLSMRITNTTYTALSMQSGDQFAKKFGGQTGNDPDFFLLTVHGKNAAGQATGAVNFFLADYRASNNAQDYIVSNWSTLDLASLGSATTSISFSLSSSDVGQFGMNTPAYFAMDNLQTVAIPEPGSFALVAVGAGLFAWRRARRRNVGASGSLALS